MLVITFFLGFYMGDGVGWARLRGFFWGGVAVFLPLSLLDCGRCVLGDPGDL